MYEFIFNGNKDQAWKLYEKRYPKCGENFYYKMMDDCNKSWIEIKGDRKDDEAWGDFSKSRPTCANKFLEYEKNGMAIMKKFENAEKICWNKWDMLLKQNSEDDAKM